MKSRRSWPHHAELAARPSHRPLFLLLAVCLGLSVLAVALDDPPESGQPRSRERLKIGRELRKF